MHRYMDRVIAASTRSAHVRRVLMEAFMMLRHPRALVAPSVLARAGLRGHRTDLGPTPPGIPAEPLQHLPAG